MWLAQAQASDRPSYVLVPRPISSISTRLRSVAEFRITAASVISTMKVERPPARSSEAPMRVKMRSNGPITARVAGTKLPMEASTRISAAWRMYVDLPPMFGPVITSMRRASVSSRSFGTNGSSSTRSTTGCRPPSMRMPGVSDSSGIT